MTANIVLVANKWWEAVALVAVLEHARDIKRDLSASPLPFDIISRRAPKDRGPEPRLRLRVAESIVTVLCIEDHIPPGADSSATVEKLRALKSQADLGAVDTALVIAFGTAASPTANSAGNVVVGSRVFLHDACSSHDENVARFPSGVGEVIDSKFDPANIAPAEMSAAYEESQRRFLISPVGGSLVPKVIASPDYVSVGVINVLRSEDYRVFDSLAVDHFELRKGPEQSVQSVDTTHGVVRLCVDRPFLYVFGISNQVGKFAEEVMPKRYSQTFTASHNAAVCVAWMLPKLCEYVSSY